MTQAERQAQTAEQYAGQVRRDNRQLGDKYRATERDILAEVPEAAREEAERHISRLVFRELAIGSDEAAKRRDNGTGNWLARNNAAEERSIRCRWARESRLRLAGALAVCAKEGKR